MCNYPCFAKGEMKLLLVHRYQPHKIDVVMLLRSSKILNCTMVLINTSHTDRTCTNQYLAIVESEMLYVRLHHVDAISPIS